MFSVRKLLNQKQPTFGDINRVFNSLWNYTKDEALEFIHSEKISPFLKTKPILNIVCNNHDFGHELIRELVKRGADLNFQTWQGMSALHCAAAYGNLKAVSMLLILGANPLLPDESGLYPLNHAALNPTDNIENDKQILNILVAQGGNDPNYVYYRANSAMSDCSNQELRDIMQTADQQRLRLTHDKDNQLTIILDKHVKDTEQRKKNKLIKILQSNYKLLSNESKEEVESAIIFDSNKLLQLNIKETIRTGIWSEEVDFGAIKVGNHYFQLFGINMFELDETIFTIHDLDTGKEIINRVFFKDLCWTLQQLEDFLLKNKNIHNLPPERSFPLFFAQEDKQQMKQIQNTDVDKAELCANRLIR
jgi:hypothetical protein